MDILYILTFLLEMTIDTTYSHKSKPFADVKNDSYMKDKDEILLSMGTSFSNLSFDIENNKLIKVFITDLCN